MMLAGNLLAVVVLYPIYSAMSAFADPVRPVVLTLLVFAQMVPFVILYTPLAAFLVEAFPANVRYTSISLPYNLGNGWFGGFLPLIATALVASTGSSPGVARLPDRRRDDHVHRRRALRDGARAGSGAEPRRPGVALGRVDGRLGVRELGEQQSHGLQCGGVLERSEPDAQPVALDQRLARMRVQRLDDLGARLGTRRRVDLELGRLTAGHSRRPDDRLRAHSLEGKHARSRVFGLEAECLGPRDAPFDQSVEHCDESGKLRAAGFAFHCGNERVSGGR